MPARSTWARSSRAGHEDRVRVVYVGIDLPACWRMAQEIKAAIGDGQVIHLARLVERLAEKRAVHHPSRTCRRTKRRRKF